jgi:hypothetical protein
MTDSLTATRRPATLAANLLAGLAVHGVASLVFAVVSAVNLEGCDRSDGLAAALAIAVAADLILAPTTFLILRRGGQANHRAWAGWALSFIPVLVAVPITLAYISSLAPGCPA